MADARTVNAAPGSLRRTLLLYLGALLAVFAVALLFAARGYGQRAANRSYDHLLVSSALSIADSVALVDGQWQVDLPYAALDLLSGRAVQVEEAGSLHRGTALGLAADGALRVQIGSDVRLFHSGEVSVRPA